MIRLRVGHTFLNDILYLIGGYNDKCEVCGEKENLEHVLMNCKTYEPERESLRKIIEGRTGVESERYVGDERKQWIFID